MTVNRKMDRIRKAIDSARQSLRHVRSYYRQPLYATAAAIAGIAIVALSGLLYEKAHTTEYYRVLLQGESIGEISSSEKVEQWLAAKSDELAQMNTPVYLVLDEGQVTYAVEKAYKKRTDDEATLAGLALKVRTHPVGVQLIIDGRVVGIVRDQQTASALLQRVRNKYTPKQADATQAAAMSTEPQIKTLAFHAGSATTLSATAISATAMSDKPQRQLTSVEFVENVRMEQAKIAPDQLSDPEQLYRKLITGSQTPVKYTVKSGDCLGCIADKMNVSPKLIYDKNPWIEDGLLQPGDTLDLTEHKPLLSVRTVEQVTQTEPIEAVIEYKKSEDMRVGQSKVLRQGQDGLKRVTYRLVKKNGSLLQEEIVSAQVLRQATSTLILKGSKVILGEGTGKFDWPVLGHQITSYMGQRWGRMHKGIDIVGGSSILAADNGVVEFAGYRSGGHGNTVIINHKNGYKTLYAHMKKVKVKKGQIVQKGDTIGIMGSTGHSTGTHLHFEVHLNGKLKNPTNFL